MHWKASDPLQPGRKAECDAQVPLFSSIKKPLCIQRLITCCRLQLLSSSISSFGSLAWEPPSKHLTAARTMLAAQTLAALKGEVFGQVSLAGSSQRLSKLHCLVFCCMHAGVGRLNMESGGKVIWSCCQRDSCYSLLCKLWTLISVTEKLWLQ